jgi:AcrR family transcriptional regulator
MDASAAGTIIADLSTRERIKGEAQRLIAEFGVDGVSTRDIVAAAGQKNVASLHYHFGSKERLIEELVVDATILMEGRRAAALDALIRSGAPISVRDLVRVLAVGAAVEGGSDERLRTVSRFVLALFPKYRRIFEAAIGDKLNVTYQTCLSMIRERAPEVPPDVLNTRLLFLSLAMLQLFAAREAAMEASPSARAYWGAPDMVETIVDAMCGMILAPVRRPGGSGDQSPLPS